MQSQQKIARMHACVHGDARAMQAMESQQPRTQEHHTMNQLRTKRDWPCKTHAQRTKYTGSQEPGTKDQEPRNKRQGPRAKEQASVMHGPTRAAKYYIYIYICIYIHASLRDPNFPSSRLPYIVPDFHAGLRGFNFPDSQILSDKLSDPNLTPFPNPMHARIKYFARSHCCKDKCTFTKT